jgi:ribosomal-protein-alanine N-acetyltransferase
MPRNGGTTLQAVVRLRATLRMSQLVDEQTVRVPELATERLLLRDWRAGDRVPFAEMNGDREVMRHFPATLTRRASDELAERIGADVAHRGWGLWALEKRATGRFIGFTGLAHVDFEASFTPAVEIGWRLARAAWGHGYATEAARAAADFAFERLHLAELVSFTAEDNARSRAVMRRLGMRHDDAHDFDHPRVSDAGCAGTSCTACPHRTGLRQRQAADLGPSNCARSGTLSAQRRRRNPWHQ